MPQSKRIQLQYGCTWYVVPISVQRTGTTVKRVNYQAARDHQYLNLTITPIIMTMRELSVYSTILSNVDTNFYTSYFYFILKD